MLVNSVQVHQLDLIQLQQQQQHKQRRRATSLASESEPIINRHHWPLLVSLSLDDQAHQASNLSLVINVTCGLAIGRPPSFNQTPFECSEHTQAKLTGHSSCGSKCTAATTKTTTTTTSTTTTTATATDTNSDQVGSCLEQAHSNTRSLAELGASLRRISDEFEQQRAQRRRRRNMGAGLSRPGLE